MFKPIPRSDWARFCRKFNQDNRFRSAKVRLDDGRRTVQAASCQPLIGLSLAKRGRNIDGIQLYIGRADAESPAEPIITIRGPQDMEVEADASGTTTGLKITAQDGTHTTIALEGQQPKEGYRQLVEKVAYDLYERRGYTHGNDFGDWFEAEKRIDRIAESLVK